MCNTDEINGGTAGNLFRRAKEAIRSGDEPSDELLRQIDEWVVASEKKHKRNPNYDKLNRIS